MLSLSLFLAALCALVSASFRDFGIPASHSTVSVKRIHVGSITLTDILPIVFHPVLPGFEALTFPIHAHFDHTGDMSQVSQLDDMLIGSETNHLPGHLTALARVTRSSFIVLGGDSFHHGGQLRPRPAFQQRFPCPAHILDSSHHAVSTEYFWSPHSTLENFDLPSRRHHSLRFPTYPARSTLIPSKRASLLTN
ncbi:hypothetical protein C8F01DRAFT_1260049 [Mycena amicta]|nr:hypothetical protein C8F01DRAFT_1260049 [Mycena amicta]